MPPNSSVELKENNHSLCKVNLLSFFFFFFRKNRLSGTPSCNRKKVLSWTQHTAASEVRTRMPWKRMTANKFLWWLTRKAQWKMSTEDLQKKWPPFAHLLYRISNFVQGCTIFRSINGVLYFFLCWLWWFSACAFAWTRSLRWEFSRQFRSQLFFLVRFCIEITARAGCSSPTLSYLWVDSCCADKPVQYTWLTVVFVDRNGWRGNPAPEPSLFVLIENEHYILIRVEKWATRLTL